jgi:hypothetical protein
MFAECSDMQNTPLCMQNTPECSETYLQLCSYPVLPWELRRNQALSEVLAEFSETQTFGGGSNPNGHKAIITGKAA